MADATQIQAQIDTTEAEIKQVSENITGYETRRDAAEKRHEQKSKEKLEVVEIVAPHQQRLQLASDQVWEAEQEYTEAVQRLVTEKSRKTELEETLTTLKADLAKAKAS